ncbi:MAG: nicotinamide-nucleotide amidase [Pseudonocardiales bacterium]|jgi:nicotinamide-nucleotide amidase|nr:nicotinamide-nucleotide amidase [Pseudonocardiales bacterium]
MTDEVALGAVPSHTPEYPTLSELVADVHEMLRAAQETVAVAESLTGGLVSAALTEVAGSSTVFRGGVVAYATDLKLSLVGVDAELLATRGAVDPAVAEGLANGVRQRLGSDWGIGITGVAGPEPQDGKPVGTVFIAISGPGYELAPETVAQLELIGDRNRIRTQAVIETVGLLREAILRRDSERG